VYLDFVRLDLVAFNKRTTVVLITRVGWINQWQACLPLASFAIETPVNWYQSDERELNRLGLNERRHALLDVMANVDNPLC
jgi:hypothetical protein